MLRVAHVVQSCFNRTETFIYDIATSSERYESWCLANCVKNQIEFPFERVCMMTVQWDGFRIVDLVDRALWKVSPSHKFPELRAIWRSRPNILHAHFGSTGWSALDLAHKHRLPLLTSFYGYDASSLPRVELWEQRLKELFNKGTGFAVEGPALRERLIGLGCPAEKIHIFPLVLDKSRYEFRYRSWEHGQLLKILFVGRFVEKKGLVVLIEAMAKVKSQVLPFELRIIGDGDSKLDLEHRVKELGLSRNVKLLGFQRRSVVVNEMEECHLLAVPSQTARDGDTEGGAPTIIMEAQAMGLPILSTRHADIPNAVAPAYAEFLAKESDAEDLAEKLLSLLNAHSKWSSMIDQARNFVVAQHSIIEGANRLDELYDRIISAYTSN